MREFRIQRASPGGRGKTVEVKPCQAQSSSKSKTTLADLLPANDFPPLSRAIKERASDAGVSESVSDTERRLSEIFSAVQDLERTIERAVTAFQEIQTRQRSLRLRLRSHADDGRVNDAHSGLFGTLDEVSVAEVIEFSRATHRTGILRVIADVNGSVHFAQGEAIYAESGEHRGFAAFCRLVGAEAGRVELHFANVSTDQRNLEGETLKLMLESLRTLDERNSQVRR